MQISEATLKKRDKDAFDGGFDAALEPMSLEEEQSVHHMRGDDGVNAVRHFLTYRRNSNRHAAAAAEQLERVADEMAGALTHLYKGTGVIDNGYCAVCKCGHRLWADGCKNPAGPCSNDDCLSRRIDASLDSYAKWKEEYD